MIIQDQEQKHAIGRAGNGKMKINELDERFNLKEIDLIDDLDFFMNNDSQFYRRVLHPMIIKVRDHIMKGGKCKDTVFRGCVDKAVSAYCKKFDIPGNEKSVFTDIDRDEVARKIFGRERDHAQKSQTGEEE